MEEKPVGEKIRILNFRFQFVTVLILLLYAGAAAALKAGAGLAWGEVLAIVTMGFQFMAVIAWMGLTAPLLYRGEVKSDANSERIAKGIENLNKFLCTGEDTKKIDVDAAIKQAREYRRGVRK